MQANAANSCGKTTAIKQSIHVSNGFNHSVSITNRVQRSAQVKLELHSGAFFPIIPRGEQTKLARYVTSAYLTVSNMTLTEDGVTKALWKCVNYPALSGTMGPHVNKKKPAPVPEMQSALGAGLSLSCQLMLQTICSPENTQYQANTLTRFNREPIEIHCLFVKTNSCLGV